MSRAIVSPHGQSATFVELFFDLVFVFGITQLVGLLHHDLSWAGAGRTALVFWMVWWAWTQFTWALNSADTTHPLVEGGTLIATALAFFMAVAIPEAYGSASMWFAGTYVAVRVVGLTLYSAVGLQNPEIAPGVTRFAILSVGGLVCAVVGAILGGSAQLALWGIAILLDLTAALVAGDSDSWNLHAEHFAERHGLIVIIALGESLIVAAGGVVGTGLSGEVLPVAVLAVLVSCGAWWTYFPIAKPRMEEASEAVTGARRSMMMRDAYSIGHVPLLAGVIVYAVGLEEALAHPATPLPTEGRLSIAVGLFLFLAGTGIAVWRTTGHMSAFRTVVAATMAAGIFFAEGVAPLATLGIAFVGVALIAAVDETRAQRLRAELAPTP